MSKDDLKINKKYLKHIDLDVITAVRSLNDHEQIVNALEWENTYEGNDFWARVYIHGWDQESLSTMMILILIKLTYMARKIEKGFA